MREPAHDQLVAPDHLLPVDAEVLARSCCGPRVTVRPQVISGPASPGQQVWIGRRARSTSLPSHTISWHGGALHRLRRHVPHRLRQREQLARVLQPLRRLRLLQRGKQPAHVAQRLSAARRCAAQSPAARPLDTHAERDAPRRAEQVGEHGNRSAPVASRTAAPGRPRATRGRRVRSFRGRGRRAGEMRRSSPSRFEAGGEIAQVFVFHLWRFTAACAAKGSGARQVVARAKRIVDFTCVAWRT